MKLVKEKNDNCLGESGKARDPFSPFEKYLLRCRKSYTSDDRIFYTQVLMFVPPFDGYLCVSERCLHESPDCHEGSVQVLSRGKNGIWVTQHHEW